MTPGLENGPLPQAAPRTILRPAEVITREDWPSESAVRSVHVVRIGGAGMSAVARLALESGLAVSGSDSQDGQFIAPLRAAGARTAPGEAHDQHNGRGDRRDDRRGDDRARSAMRSHLPSPSAE